MAPPVLNVCISRRAGSRDSELGSPKCRPGRLYPLVRRCHFSRFDSRPLFFFGGTPCPRSRWAPGPLHTIRRKLLPLLLFRDGYGAPCKNNAGNSIVPRRTNISCRSSCVSANYGRGLAQKERRERGPDLRRERWAGAEVGRECRNRTPDAGRDERGC
jgi:hypothetical protein